MSENVKLARLMRECAAFVERNEFSPSMYQVIGELHAYAGKHSDAKGQLASKQPGASWTSLSKKLHNFGIAASSSQTKQATSSKNAERVNRDLEDVKKSGSAEDDSWTSWWTGSGGGGDEKPAAPSKPGKPAFQRPSNPNSTLIANGWIEQLRRSKMRVVWKDVLASLVEGRKEKEETTMWIQREVINATTGKHELEALHQIPIKWLQEVKYLDFYGDFRFAIKVFNISDEFVFRCADEESAQNWILTLRSFTTDEKLQKQIEHSRQQQNVEASAPFDEDDGKQFASLPNSGGTPSSIRSVPIPPPVSGAARAASSQSLDDPPPATRSTPLQEAPAAPRMTVSEMRAIAHGSGVSTQGMERSDLKRLVARLTGATSAAAVTSSTKAADDKHRQEVELARRRQALEHQESIQRKAEAAAIDREHDEEKRRILEEVQRQQVGDARRKADEDELKRLAAIAEEKLRAAALVEERRRVDEQRRQAEDQRRLVAAAEDQRRRVAEQQAADQRRRQDEDRARAQQHYQQQQQAWQHQQAAQHQWQQQQAAAQQAAALAAQQAQWQQFHQQQQKQQQSYPQQQQQQQKQNPFGNTQQQPAPATNGDTSTADLKYTKMAEESKDDGQKIAAVKRNILVHWALQPPQQQHLRPIADLLTAIHTVFPPAFGVAGHTYFAKWTAINRTDLIPVGSGPDEEKLKKAVRKLRFFLHPDKLPRDLNDEQTFMCKMLWDISSDAWEEYKKRHEELDWIQK